MFLVCDEFGLLLGKASPEAADNCSILRIQGIDDGVRKGLPAVLGMAIGFAFLNCQSRVEH